MQTKTDIWEQLQAAKNGCQHNLSALMKEAAAISMERAKVCCLKYQPTLSINNDVVDITNTALVKLFPTDTTKGIFAVRDKSRVKNFIIRVTSHEAYNLLRKRKAEAEKLRSLDSHIGGNEGLSLLKDYIADTTAPDPSAGSPEEIERQNDKRLKYLQTILNKSMMKLSANERLAIYYRYQSDANSNLTLKQVAKIMDVNEQQVTNWVYRGLAKLQNIMKDIDIPDVL